MSIAPIVSDAEFLHANAGIISVLRQLYPGIPERDLICSIRTARWLRESYGIDRDDTDIAACVLKMLDQPPPAMPLW